MAFFDRFHIALYNCFYELRLLESSGNKTNQKSKMAHFV
jgi:hypothetical protein